MSVITWPGYRVASMRWNKATQAVTFRSIFGAQSLEGSAPLWEVDLQGVSEDRASARGIQSFIESLSGYVNQVALWNVEQPAPAGTMRGALTVYSGVLAGDAGFAIAGGISQAGKTLLKGDLIGIGSGISQQVLRIAADAIADGSGNIVVSLGAPLRNTFGAGTSIVWDKPAALFRQKALSAGIDFQPQGAQPWSLSLIEDFRP
jgi:hypothetical protein